MNWDKINIKSVLEVLREIEKNSPTINGEQKIIYSDSYEELSIIYRRKAEKELEK